MLASLPPKGELSKLIFFFFALVVSFLLYFMYKITLPIKYSLVQQAQVNCGRVIDSGHVAGEI